MRPVGDARDLPRQIGHHELLTERGREEIARGVVVADEYGPRRRERDLLQERDLPGRAGAVRDVGVDELYAVAEIHDEKSFAGVGRERVRANRARLLRAREHDEVLFRVAHGRTVRATQPRQARRHVLEDLDLCGQRGANRRELVAAHLLHADCIDIRGKPAAHRLGDSSAAVLFFRERSDAGLFPVHGVDPVEHIPRDDRESRGEHSGRNPVRARYMILHGHVTSPVHHTSRAPNVSVPPAPAGPVHLPDLLHAVPLRRIDAEQARLGIALAFAAGAAGGVFGDALDRATFAPSSWDPSSFTNDLFLREFVVRCFKVTIDGQEPVLATKHLVGLLAHPPADVATVAHRRTILAELASSAPLRAQAEKLYTSLCRLRTLIEGATGAGKWDTNRRQLDILVLVKDIMDTLAEGFLGARSGLSVLAAFGRRVQEGEPYRSLADLLRFDEQLATLNLKVRVGADGRIRGFEVLNIQEEDKNPFVASPLRRFLGKVELWLRGFKFSDGEVMARLIDAVFDGIHDELVPLVQLLGELEFYLGALGFADRARAAGLEVCLPELVSPDAPRSLLGLFNPHLLAHGVRPVPCSITIDRQAATVLITGPNSGGKTRLLQSVGLAQLLAQNGLFVPARSAQLALSPGLVMSLIEEARADQAEGRLGTELVRIRALFERLPPGAMVILDELCSGTNPSEGEEIFELVVQMLTRLAPQAFITTHFLQFAARLEREQAIEGLRFLQVELGPTLRPTYQFTAGVAATSLAAHAASRLGVTRDQLAELIDHNVLLAAKKKA